MTDDAPSPAACLMIIYAADPVLLGKRYPLVRDIVSIGRSADNHIAIHADGISRRHARLEMRAEGVVLVDLGSTNGTFHNGTAITGEVALRCGDRVALGTTIFKFLSGPDAQVEIVENVYRVSNFDRLTGLHNKRYLYLALDQQTILARRHEHPLSVVLLDINHFKRLNDEQGHLAGDRVLQELAPLLRAHIEADDVAARYRGDGFALILPRRSLIDAGERTAALQEQVRGHVFTYQASRISITVRAGTAALLESDHGSSDLLSRATAELDLAGAQR